MIVPTLARARRLRGVGRGRRGRVAVKPRLLLVAKRAVERREFRLDDVVGGKRRSDALLRCLEPHRWHGGHVLRTVGGEPLRRLLGPFAQAVERSVLSLVGVDAARNRIERPILELGALRSAAAHELLDRGGEQTAAAAGQRGFCALGVAGVVAIQRLFVLASCAWRGHPFVDRAGGAALAIAIVTVMAAPGVGARGKAHADRQHEQRRQKSWFQAWGASPVRRKQLNALAQPEFPWAVTAGGIAGTMLLFVPPYRCFRIWNGARSIRVGIVAVPEGRTQ